MRLSHIALALLSFAAVMARDIKENDKPWFCHGLDCPDFSTEKTTDDWEVRQYAAGVLTRPSSSWLCASCALARLHCRAHYIAKCALPRQLGSGSGMMPA